MHNLVNLDKVISQMLVITKWSHVTPGMTNSTCFSHDLPIPVHRINKET